MYRCRNCYDKDADKRYPVETPLFMPLDQFIHHSWKNLKGGLYDTWGNRAPSKKTLGGFVNEVYKSGEQMPIKYIRNAIDEQSDIIKCGSV